MPVVGYLGAQSADDDYKYNAVPFLGGLRETGYVEGGTWWSSTADSAAA